MVGRSPCIKPSRVELAAHQRAFWLHFPELLERAFSILTEVDDIENVRVHSLVQLVNGIAGEEGHVETGILEDLAEFPHINRVVAVGAVFVFQLGYQDRSTFGDLQWTQHASDFIELGGGGFHEIRILAAEFDVRVFQQPPGRAAAIPPGTNVGSGTKHDPQAFF